MANWGRNSSLPRQGMDGMGGIAHQVAQLLRHGHIAHHRADSGHSQGLEKAGRLGQHLEAHLLIRRNAGLASGQGYGIVQAADPVHKAQVQGSPAGPDPALRDLIDIVIAHAPAFRDIRDELAVELVHIVLGCLQVFVGHVSPGGEHAGTLAPPHAPTSWLSDVPRNRC